MRSSPAATSASTSPRTSSGSGPSGWGTRSRPCSCPPPASSASREWARRRSTRASRSSQPAAGSHAEWRSAPARASWRPRRRPRMTLLSGWRRTAGRESSSHAFCCARSARPSLASCACSARAGTSGTSSADPLRRLRCPTMRNERVSWRTGAARASPGLPAISSRAASPCSWPWRTLRVGARASRRLWRVLRESRCRSSPGPPSPQRREPAGGFDHLVALDPPPLGIADPLLDVTPRAHLAWGPARGGLRDRPSTAPHSTCGLSSPRSILALRQLPPNASGAEIETALRGTARYPRGAAACARLLKVLTELGLIEFDVSARAVGISTASEATWSSRRPIATLATSSTATERALAPELPRLRGAGRTRPGRHGLTIRVNG